MRSNREQEDARMNQHKRVRNAAATTVEEDDDGSTNNGIAFSSEGIPGGRKKRANVAGAAGTGMGVDFSQYSYSPDQQVSAVGTGMDHLSSRAFLNTGDERQQQQDTWQQLQAAIASQGDIDQHISLLLPSATANANPLSGSTNSFSNNMNLPSNSGAAGSSHVMGLGMQQQQIQQSFGNSPCGQQQDDTFDQLMSSIPHPTPLPIERAGVFSSGGNNANMNDNAAVQHLNANSALSPLQPQLPILQQNNWNPAAEEPQQQNPFSALFRQQGQMMLPGLNFPSGNDLALSSMAAAAAAAGFPNAARDHMGSGNSNADALWAISARHQDQQQFQNARMIIGNNLASNWPLGSTDSGSASMNYLTHQLPGPVVGGGPHTGQGVAPQANIGTAATDSHQGATNASTITLEWMLQQLQQQQQQADNRGSNSFRLPLRPSPQGDLTGLHPSEEKTNSPNDAVAVAAMSSDRLQEETWSRYVGSSSNMPHNNTESTSSMTLTAPRHASVGDSSSQSNSHGFLSVAHLATGALPELEDGSAVEHYSRRNPVPLGIDQDSNFLTEFQTLIRFEFLEVFRVTQHDTTRKRSAVGRHEQAGIRCRFCAHLDVSSRASRSSAFPSSIRQLYQSFTMMLRDHFGKCTAVPEAKAALFRELKKKNSQGASDSKHYWMYAAQRIGMVDAEHGIVMTRVTQVAALRLPPFGVDPDVDPAPTDSIVILAKPQDEMMISPFLYSVLKQIQLVHLVQSEKVGKRRTLEVGLSGMGCTYCYRARWLGFSRVFPLRRRTLASKVIDLYHHLQRCPLCPDDVKESLQGLFSDADDGKRMEQKDSAFFDELWSRMGRTGDMTT